MLSFLCFVLATVAAAQEPVIYRFGEWPEDPNIASIQPDAETGGLVVRMMNGKMDRNDPPKEFSLTYGQVTVKLRYTGYPNYTEDPKASTDWLEVLSVSDGWHASPESQFIGEGVVGEVKLMPDGLS